MRFFAVRRPALCTALFLALVLVAVLPLDAPAAPGDIETVAGGPGNGAALGVGVAPRGLAVAGDLVYMTDVDWQVVRVLDLSSGALRVVAGNGTAGYGGDGGPATEARLQSPYGVAVDGDGNVYVADAGNHRIRRIAPDGTITTVAGTGVAGFAGDGGAATAARLWGPRDVLVGADGALYVADTLNHRVRRIADGVITTVAGTGSAGYAGDGGLATSARVYAPHGLGLGADGALLVADTFNHRVRRIAEGVITTVAGNGVAGFGGDGGLATDASLRYPYDVSATPGGTVLVADVQNHRIRAVAPDGVITTLAGTGLATFDGDGRPASETSLRQPLGVGVLADGRVLIADTFNYRLRVVQGDGSIATVAGIGTCCSGGDGGPATDAQLWFPAALAADASGGFYVADLNDRRVRHVTRAGGIATIAGTGANASTGDGGLATEASLASPQGLAVGPDGTVYLAEPSTNRVRAVGTDGIIRTVAGTGAYGATGDGGPATSASFRSPIGLATAADGSLYIADAGNNKVRRVRPDGIVETVAGNGVAGSAGDGGPATEASLRSPQGVAVSSDGALLIADTGNHSVRRVAPDGTITRFAGSGVAGFSGDGGAATAATLRSPRSVAVTGDGTVLIADTSNRRIRAVGTDGVITTVAGNGAFGFSGDGGPATEAAITNPYAVAVDTRGSILIADSFNRRVRRIPVDVTPPVTTASLDGVAGDDGWWRGPVTVTLSATDDRSGVAATLADLDGAGWNVVTAPIEITGDGEHLLSYRSRDNAGNEEDPKTLTVRIDATPPAVSIAAPEPPVLAGSEITLDWNVTDATSGVASSTGAFAGEAVTDGQRVRVDRPGSYELTVTARDAAGNEAAASATIEVLAVASVDMQPATLNARGNGDAPVTVTVELPAGLGLAGAPAVIHGPRGTATSRCDGPNGECAKVNDRDADGLPDVTFRFARDEVRAAAPAAAGEWRVEVRGRSEDGSFGWIGWTTIRVG